MMDNALPRMPDHAQVKFTSPDNVNKQVLDGLVLRAKAQIALDALNGTFSPRPAENKTGKISCYSDLHDYVDANYYGGAFEEHTMNALTGFLGFAAQPEGEPTFGSEAEQEVVYQFLNLMQEEVDRWIREGGLKVILTLVEGHALDRRLIAITASGIHWIPDVDFLEAFL